MIFSAPHLVLPPERPALVRANDLRGIPSWQEMQSRQKATFPFPFVPRGPTLGNDSYTKILLHMDGSNGGTTFTDNCVGASPHTFTAHSATTSTTQTKFGLTSGSFSGTTSWIDTPDSTDFTLGSGAWTIDTQFYWSGGSGVRGFLAGQGDSTGSATLSAWTLEHRTTDVMRIIVSDSASSSFVLDGTTAITAAGWHHLAVVRTGNVLRLFLDGTQEGGDLAITTSVRDSANTLAVGRGGELTTTTWNGFIDEFRLSVGIARWTANFTPPTQAYL